MNATCVTAYDRVLGMLLLIRNSSLIYWNDESVSFYPVSLPFVKCFLSDECITVLNAGGAEGRFLHLNVKYVINILIFHDVESTRSVHCDARPFRPP